MRAAFLIASKDLKQRLRDRSAFMLGFVAPLGLAFIFSLIIPDFSGASFLIETAVADLDDTELSRAFTDQVLPPISDDGLIVVTLYSDADDLRTDVDSGVIRAAWIIPEGFGEAVTSGSPTAIEVVGNVDAQISTEIAVSIARSYVADVAEAQLAAAVAQGAGLGDPLAFAMGTRLDLDLVVLSDVSAASKELSGTTFFPPAWPSFSLLHCAVRCVESD